MRTHVLACADGIANGDSANLARLRPAAASRIEFQTLQRPQFVETVRDIVGLYMNPPDKVIVLCVDLKKSGAGAEVTQRCVRRKLHQCATTGENPACLAAAAEL